MLLFIKVAPVIDSCFAKFQYISCYCLSNSTIGKTWKISYFNTSHVTVYLQGSCRRYSQNAFQYISCYCLSGTGYRADRGQWWFQYISCYCLSMHRKQLIPAHTYFNTSHVTVYPLSGWYGYSYPGNFNTSHVTVYQFKVHSPDWARSISIHLMLLFIFAGSCLFFAHSVISIHLMLLFIEAGKNKIMEELRFQYISCYCLSNELTPFYIFLRI